MTSDRYLTLAEDRAKAVHLAQISNRTDTNGLARAYYEMTADVDARRRARFLAHITCAEQRGEALAALLPRQGRVLEVGCGSGGLLAAAARLGIDIHGVDIALRWLVVARRRLIERHREVPLIGASAEQLPWPDGSFDAVVADSVLEHLSDPRAALMEWKRILMPGGRLIVWSPNRYSLATDPHVQLWGLGWLPSSWASAYVRLRRGCEWSVRPLSARAARRLAHASGLVRVEIESPPVRELLKSARSRAARLMMSAYGIARGTRAGASVLRNFGPLWQLSALKGE